MEKTLALNEIFNVTPLKEVASVEISTCGVHLLQENIFFSKEFEGPRGHKLKLLLLKSI